MIDILNRYKRVVLYHSETAQTIADAVLEAHAAHADLRCADLRCADLRDDFHIAASLQVSGMAEWGTLTALLSITGAVWIMIGCQSFSLEDAETHWEAREDRARTRAVLGWVKQWAAAERVHWLNGGEI